MFIGADVVRTQADFCRTGSITDKDDVLRRPRGASSCPSDDRSRSEDFRLWGLTSCGMTGGGLPNI